MPDIRPPLHREHSFRPQGLRPLEWSATCKVSCEVIQRAVVEHEIDPTGYGLHSKMKNLKLKVENVVLASSENGLKRIISREINARGQIKSGWSDRWPDPLERRYLNPKCLTAIALADAELMRTVTEPETIEDNKENDRKLLNTLVPDAKILIADETQKKPEQAVVLREP